MAVLDVGTAGATDLSAVVTGAETMAGGAFSSAALDGETTVDDTLMTGLLITDTVLVVNPCTEVALVEAAGGMPKVGRPAVFSTVEGGFATLA